ncbi:MAG: hypothetical protein Kow00121_33120 [Elainellaceae cyanobacterium]
MPQPGHHVRRLARQRRFTALQFLLIAGCCLIFPFYLSAFLSVWIYLIGFVWAGLSVLQARHYWIRAKQADQGAAGEEEIARVLATLGTQGWAIEYGIADRSVGDIDVFLRSPEGKAYIIDVKSHRGRVQTDGESLYRRYGQTKKPFEKDFLAQARRQALAAKRLKKLSFVTPIVAFSHAKVEVGKQSIAGVYVVGKHELVRVLQLLG